MSLDIRDTGLLSSDKKLNKEVIAMEGTATGLSAVVTQDMLSGVLDEVIALLPIAIPVVIGFIALRKGISFLIGILRSA